MSKINDEAAELGGYVSEFLNYYAPQILTNSPHTLEAYEVAMTLYIGYLEEYLHIKPEEFSAKCFDKKHIEDWKIWLKTDRKNSGETINVRLSSLRAFIKYLSSRSPKYLFLLYDAKSVEKAKTTKRKVHGITREAVKALLDAPNTNSVTGIRDLTLLVVLYGTAARLDEALSIQIRDIHLEADEPYIDIMGKGDKHRTVFLLPMAVGHIENYIKVFHGNTPDPDNYLFFTRNAGKHKKLSQSAVRSRLKINAERAHGECEDVPLDLHSHQLRHARATHWLDEGMNVVQISYLLGHASVETTMKYLDIPIKQIKEAMATLEDENDKNVKPKWNSKTDSLASICKIKRLKGKSK